MQFMQMQQKQLQSIEERLYKQSHPQQSYHDERDYRDSYRVRYRGNYRRNRQGYHRGNIHVRNRGEVQNNYNRISSTGQNGYPGGHRN